MTEKEKGKKEALIAGSYSVLLLCLGLGVIFFINEVILDKVWNTNYLIISSMIILAMIAYAFIERKRLFPKAGNAIYMLICFLLSSMLFLLPDFYVNFPIWLAGGIFVAAVQSRNLGLFYTYFFVVQAIYLQSGSVRGLVLHFVTATILCLLITRMRTWLSMLYLMAISSALIVCLSIFLNGMRLDQDLFLNVVWILAVYLLCILIAKVLRTLFLPELSIHKEKKNTPSEEKESGYHYLELVAEQTKEEVPDISQAKQEKVASIEPEARKEYESKQEKADSLESEAGREYESKQDSADTIKQEVQQEELREDYSDYCKESSELLVQLKTVRKSTYIHSLLVGKLAAEAAKLILADEKLTMAIGYYHEIGKLREGKATEQTICICEEHEFPTSLIEAIRECNMQDNDKIKKKEAAVAMMSDTILTTYFYLRNNKNFTTSAEKIVDNTLSMFISKKKLNKSGLSIEDCSILREFFVTQLTHQDEKRK